MFLKKKKKKESFNILLSENKRLKRENQRLRESLQELQEYKNEYSSLIEHLNEVKSSYQKKLKEFDKLEKH